MNRTFAALLVTLSSSATLAQDTAPAGKPSFDFAPSIIDAKNGTGSTLGVDYKLKGDRTLKSFDGGDSGSAFNPKAVAGQWVLAYEAKGTATASADRNPRNFLEFGIDTKLQRSSEVATVMSGIFVKYETDQRFVNKQAVVGFSGTLAKYKLFARNDYLLVNVGYGRVDPTGDKEREKAVGDGNLTGYYRWNAEGLFKIPVSNGTIRSLELNVRYFLEPGAPAAVRSADLDRHALGTIHLGLKNDLFVAYSVGTLPFDRKSDNVFALGFSYKLQ